jgi:hypothetical protein
LRWGPRPAAELKEDAVQHGRSWATIRRAADELEVEKTGGRGSTWSLPAELIEQLETEEAEAENSDDACCHPPAPMSSCAVPELTRALNVVISRIGAGSTWPGVVHPCVRAGRVAR